MINGGLGLEEAYIEGFSDLTMPLLEINALWARYMMSKKIDEALITRAENALGLMEKVDQVEEKYWKAAMKTCKEQNIPTRRTKAAENTINPYVICESILNGDATKYENWPPYAFARLYEEGSLGILPSEGIIESEMADVVDFSKREEDQRIDHIIFAHREKKALELATKHTFPVIVYGIAHEFLDQIRAFNIKKGPTYSLIEIYPNAFFNSK